MVSQPGGRGFDAGKKICGRKRHLLVDTRMEWTRSWLSLGAVGDEVIEHWSPTAYEAMMARHEQEMAHYLRTGKLLPEVAP